MSDDAGCGLPRAQGDEEHVFLDMSLKLRSTFSLSLASKSVALDFSVWTSKSTATIC
jgi:hypothetical protein